MVSVKFIFKIFCVLCLFFGKQIKIHNSQCKREYKGGEREEQLHFMKSE